MNTNTPSIDFIGIGAHKSATTWLAHVMRSHPEVWIPPAKELHYFDREAHYDSPNNLSYKNFFDRLTGTTPDNKNWRKSAIRDILAALLKRDFDRLRWNTRYYTGTISDDWYLNLFPTQGFTAVGEITPAYAMLSAEDISRILHLAPKVKIIYLLRDPIDRAWSHIRYDSSDDSVRYSLENIDEIKAFIDSPRLTLRGDYLGTLIRWKSQVPSKQLFVGYYDDIQQRPMDFLVRLSNFLGIDPDSFSLQDVNSNVMPSKKHNIPRDIERYLAEKYHKDLQELEKMLGGHVSLWRQRSHDILNQSNERRKSHKVSLTK